MQEPVLRAFYRDASQREMTVTTPASVFCGDNVCTRTTQLHSTCVKANDSIRRIAWHSEVVIGVTASRNEVYIRARDSV